MFPPIPRDITYLLNECNKFSRHKVKISKDEDIVELDELYKPISKWLLKPHPRFVPFLPLPSSLISLVPLVEGKRGSSASLPTTKHQDKGHLPSVAALEEDHHHHHHVSPTTSPTGGHCCSCWQVDNQLAEMMRRQYSFSKAISCDFMSPVQQNPT